MLDFFKRQARQQGRGQYLPFRATAFEGRKSRQPVCRQPFQQVRARLPALDHRATNDGNEPITAVSPAPTFDRSSRRCFMQWHGNRALCCNRLREAYKHG
jgi:hypothetical protein